MTLPLAENKAYLNTANNAAGTGKVSPKRKKAKNTAQTMDPARMPVGTVVGIVTKSAEKDALVAKKAPTVKPPMASQLPALGPILINGSTNAQSPAAMKSTKKPDLQVRWADKKPQLSRSPSVQSLVASIGEMGWSDASTTQVGASSADAQEPAAKKASLWSMLKGWASQASSSARSVASTMATALLHGFASMTGALYGVGQYLLAAMKKLPASSNK